MKFEFTRPFKCKNEVNFKLEPSQSGSQASWIMDEPTVLSPRRCRLSWTWTRWWADFELGLANLDSVTGRAADKGTGSASLNDNRAQSRARRSRNRHHARFRCTARVGVRRLDRSQARRAVVGTKGYTSFACEIDLRVGGVFRLQMRGPDGAVYPCRGVFREVVNRNGSSTRDVSEAPPLRSRPTSARDRDSHFRRARRQDDAHDPHAIESAADHEAAVNAGTFPGGNQPSNAWRRRDFCFVSLVRLARLLAMRCQDIYLRKESVMSGVRVLVGTRKGAFVLTSDGKRESGTSAVRISPAGRSTI